MISVARTPINRSHQVKPSLAAAQWEKLCEGNELKRIQLLSFSRADGLPSVTRPDY